MKQKNDINDNSVTNTDKATSTILYQIVNQIVIIETESNISVSFV